MKKSGLLATVLGGILYVGLQLASVHAQVWTDLTPALASRCASADVDDACPVIENCKVNDAPVVYVAIAP